MGKKTTPIIICIIAIAVISMLYYPIVNQQVKSWPQYRKQKDAITYSKNLNENMLNHIEYKDDLRIEEVAAVTKPITDDMLNIQLNARAACLMDASTGRVLYGKKVDTEMPMASTTKIMTLIVTLENARLDDVVTVSKYAARQPDVQLNMNTGDQFKLEDLLYSLMLESHNDDCVILGLS